jgi:hypothetical protein
MVVPPRRALGLKGGRQTTSGLGGLATASAATEVKGKIASIAASDPRTIVIDVLRIG